MSSAHIEKRVIVLEQVLADFIVAQGKSLIRLETEMIGFKDEMKDFKDEMRDFKDEMRDFKDEMRDFKDEMKDFKDEMRDFKDEMRDFKDEMKDFKDEMKDFKDEMKDFKDEMKDFKDEMKDFKVFVEKDIAESKEDRRQMTKQWGDLANKLGTVVEDIVFPASRPVLEKYFGEPIPFIFIHAVKKVKSMRIEGEYDVVAVSDKRVFIIEVKTTPGAKYLQEFESNLVKFRKLFPEYNHLGLIPVFAGLRFEKPFIDKATAKGIYVMAYREWDYMDILNFDNLPLADATRY